MIVIVTGAEGQVGSEVVSLFERAGHTVFPFNSTTLDIRNSAAIQAQLAPIQAAQALINCAAYTAVDRAEDEPEKAFQVNADAVKNLAEHCRDFNIPLLHLSTDYIFDGQKQGGYEETDAPHPQNIYGESKWAGEEFLRWTWEKHIILRVSWVFGRNGNNFVKTITRLANERPQLKIVADQRGSPTGASHIAKTLLTLLNHPQLEENFGTYHYTDAPLTTWFDFAKSFIPEKSCELLPISTQDYPTQAKRPLNSHLNCDKIKRIFGIEQAYWQDELS